MHRHILPAFCALVVAAISATAAGREEIRPFDNVEGWGLVVDPIGDCLFTHEGGRLTINVPGSYHDLWPGKGKVNAPLVLQDVAGDFSVEVEVSRVQRAEPGTAIAGLGSSVAFHAGTLVIWQDAKSFVRLDRTDMNKAGRAITSCYLHVFQDGRRTVEVAPVVADMPTRLRIARRGNQLTAAYSQDGGSMWRAISSQRIEMPDKLKAGVSALNNTSRPCAVVFDQFKIIKAP